MEQTDKTTMIPYIVYESMLSKEDTQQRRMIYVMIAEALIILIVIALFVANEYHWRKLWNEYDYVDDTTEISAEQDGGGVNIVGGGDVDYGTEGNDKADNSQKSTP